MPVSNEFTKSDAESLITIAQEAPIPGGARQAQLRSELYQRFVKFYEKTTTVPRSMRKKAASQVEVSAEDVTK